jgi:hypothetical protein
MPQPSKGIDIMNEPSNREVIERYMRAIPGESDTLAALRHRDFVQEYPQSGEVIRGDANWRAAHARYVGVQRKTRHVTGSEDRWILSPSVAGFTPTRIVGSGDTFTVESMGTYPDGESYHVIAIVELRGGLVYRVRTYFAAPFEAPDWRAQWVEPMAESTHANAQTGAGEPA